MRRSFMAMAGSILLLAMLAGCRQREPGTATVLAAASLTEVLPRLGAQFAAQREANAPRLSFDATSRLAAQIEAGAQADAFVSADARWMEHLIEREAVRRSTVRKLATNRIVVVVPIASAWKPGQATDLVSPRLQRLALAGAAVPAGRYARAALRSLGVWDELGPRVVEGASVRSVLAWVASGEVDAGIVYRTDAAVEPEVRIAMELPASSHPEVAYYGAVTTRAARPRLAARLLAFCEGPAGREVFEKAGFTVP